MSGNTEIVNNWVADGTAEAEPVTTETPEPVEAAPEPVEQPRDEHGKWVAGETVEATTEPAEAPVELPENPTPAEVQEYIEARLGEEPFQLPKGVRLPIKRGDVIEYEPLEELQKRGMFERDYRVKTHELGRTRTEVNELKARLEAREAYVKEQEENFKSILRDPQKAAAYEEHLRQYENNPIYRQNVDTALRARELEAVNQTYQQQHEQNAVARGVEMAQEWIGQLAEKYPNVDPERAAEMYGAALREGRASLDFSDAERIFKTEADYLHRSVTPLQSELANLKAQVEALKASQAAEKHNATTQHAVARAATPRVATGTGSPAPTQRPKPKPFHISELADRNSEWSKVRD